MWVAPVVAIAAVMTLALLRPISLLVAMPILALWLISPVSPGGSAGRLPAVRRGFQAADPLSPYHGAENLGFLRDLRWSGGSLAAARQLSGASHPVVAHRTSPTNMGLSLLANLSAYDFGYIGPGKLIERTANALRTMDTLERYRGHFYNWYDTQSLKPLLPHYISSVDSGNLAGHLLILRQGLLALPDDTILGRRFLEGLRDTLACAVDAAGANPEEGIRFTQLHQELAAAIDSHPTQLSTMQQHLAHWATEAEVVVGTQRRAPMSRTPCTRGPRPLPASAGMASTSCCSLPRGWRAAALRPGSGTLPDLDRIPTLRELAALEEHLRPRA
jgi:cyclic beta-1,2-glucan synthetase